MDSHSSDLDLVDLAAQIKVWGEDLGFDKLAISHIDLAEHEDYLKQWLARGFHGEMSYMADHGNMRSRPAELVPGTLRVISARMNYLAVSSAEAEEVLQQPDKAYISRYALGRDYHKVVRKRLKKLADKIHHEIQQMGYRAFVDSAPVLEKALGEQAGLGWIGKHTLLLDRSVGSWFFLGELFIDLPLPVDAPVTQHCGSCTACIDICPTKAIVAPYQLDARLCISYLTIEQKGSIPVELRKPMGNRVFGCDDCQLVCPWNRYAQVSSELDFKPRHGLDDVQLLELFAWDEATYLSKTEGMPLRRVGYAGWVRNIAVALGNADYDEQIVKALSEKTKPGRESLGDMPAEHIHWALEQQLEKKPV